MHNIKSPIEVFNKHAQQYQDKFMEWDLYNDTFNLFCDSIKKNNAEILEVACGPGNITKYLLNKRSDFKIFGIDLAPNMVALAAVNNPAAAFALMDCRDIRSLNKKYDAIMCGFCLPYLSNEETAKFISDAKNSLHSDGVLYISTMEKDETHQPGIKTSATGNTMYMNYYSADDLSNTLKENGFTILHLQRKIFPEQDGTTTTDLIIIAIK